MTSKCVVLRCQRRALNSPASVLSVALAMDVKPPGAPLPSEVSRVLNLDGDKPVLRY
jgi:hypothetical protein